MKDAESGQVARKIKETAPELGVAKFNEYEAQIAALKPHRELTIAGIDDKEGAKIVKAARIECKNIRVKIESGRKEIKAPFLEACKTIDSNAAKFQADVAEAENHLKAEEAKVVAEIARIAKEIADAKAKVIQERIELINKMDCVYTGFSYVVAGVELLQSDVDNMADDVFNVELLKMQALNELAIEEAAAKAEAETKAAAELKTAQDAAEKAAAEIAKKEQELREREAALKATEEAEVRAAEKLKEQKAAAELAAKAAAEKAEADKKAAVEKAKLDAEAKTKAAQDAKIKAEAAAKAKAEKAPDKEKLHALSDDIQGLKIPEMSSEAGKKAIITIKEQMAKMQNWLYSQAENL